MSERVRVYAGVRVLWVWLTHTATVVRSQLCGGEERVTQPPHPLSSLRLDAAFVVNYDQVRSPKLTVVFSQSS